MNGIVISFVAIAVVAVGTFALPNTVSLFSGQHTWYDLGLRGNDVPCEKCHADIEAEMDARIGPHTGETGYGRLKCGDCHRVFPIEHRNASFDAYTYASGDDTAAEPGKEAHAASTVPCMYCHSGDESGMFDLAENCLACHNGQGLLIAHELNLSYPLTNPEDCYRCHPAMGHFHLAYHIPPAGGFNLTTNSADTSEMAAHKTFVMNAISNQDMEDANEACIACHTHVAVKINWTHRVSLEFNCTPEFDLPPTHFNVTDWSVNGTYNVTVYGNRTGSGNLNGSNWPGAYP